MFISGLCLEDTVNELVNTSCIPAEQFGHVHRKMAEQLVYSKNDAANKNNTCWTPTSGGVLLCRKVEVQFLYLRYSFHYISQNKLTNNCHSMWSANVYSSKWAHYLKGLPNPTENNFVKSLIESVKITSSKALNKKDHIDADI